MADLIGQQGIGFGKILDSIDCKGARGSFAEMLVDGMLFINHIATNFVDS